MKTLAKHDALSYAMIQENGGAKKFLERYPHLDFECLLEPITLDLMKNAIDNAVQSNIRILEVRLLPVKRFGREEPAKINIYYYVLLNSSSEKIKP